jgi:uncharacterized membrane protein YsdA (DUF1294 family)
MAKSNSVRRSGSPYLIFSLVAVAIVLVIALGMMLWLGIWWLWSYLVAINAATFLLYGYDKAIAGGDQTRVPERVLHLAELFGGTPAAFVAQRVFHHKTQKSSFQLRFWLIVVVQIAAVAAIWWLTRG